MQMTIDFECKPVRHLEQLSRETLVELDAIANRLEDFGANRDDCEVVESEGHAWVALTSEEIEGAGSAFARQVALAVFAGTIAITPTRDGIGFRGL